MNLARMPFLSSTKPGTNKGGSTNRNNISSCFITVTVPASKNSHAVLIIIHNSFPLSLCFGKVHDRLTYYD